jgi:hypothetical protein
MKLELFIMGRNSVLMRVENIADVFDSAGKVIFQLVKIKQLAEDLFVLVNGEGTSFSVKIEELSLTAN